MGGARTWPSEVRLCPARSAFRGDDLELAVSYTAKKSYCRRAVELTRTWVYLSRCRWGCGSGWDAS